MRSELGRKLERLEAAKGRVIDQIASIDPSLHNTPPAEESWSLAQALEHVIGVESGSLSYMKRKLEGDREELPRTSVLQSVRNALVTVALKTPLRFRAPAVVATMSEEGSVEELLASWLEVREELKELLETFPDELRDRQVFRHPVSGRMTMSETLTFMVHHLEHHERQFARICSALAAGS